MTMGGERERDEREWSRRDKTDADADPAPASPAAATLRGMLQRGRPSAQAVVALLSRYPHEYEAIFTLLHQTIGNHFVQEVVAELSAQREPHETQPSSSAQTNPVDSPADNGRNDLDHEPETEIDTRAVAAAGFSGGARQLPHLEQIQHSFGAHDVADVRAHVGGPATVAANQLGATAYASGEQVAFASPPDLHTAAHEAAHVVQNRAGADERVAGADGALTSPDHARERHADAVADRVVRGESAAALLASPPPAGGAQVARKAKPPPDAAAAMAELKAQLDHGVTDPARVPVLVTMLSWEDKVAVRDKFDAIERACTPSQILTIGRALGIGPDSVKAALRKGARARELESALRTLEDFELVVLAEDPKAFAELRARLAGPASVHARQFDYVPKEIAESGPLMHWLVETTSPLEIWRRIRVATSKKEIAATFDSEGLWGWTSKLTPAGMTDDDVDNLRDFIAATTDDTAKSQLAAIAARSPQPVSPDDPAAAKRKDDAQHAAVAELKTMLAGEKPLDANALLEVAARAKWSAWFLAKDAHARRRILQALDGQQLASLLSTVQLDPAEQIDWLLDKPDSSVDSLVPALLSLTDRDAATVFGNAARVARLHKKIGNDRSLLALVNPGPKLQNLALANPELRRWLIGTGLPDDLLTFVTMAPTAESIASAFDVVSKDYGSAWVYELSASPKSGPKIRRLALALPDRAAGRHLLKYGVEDQQSPTNIISRPEASAPDVYSTAGQQLHDAVATGHGDDIAAEAAELSDAERAAIRADRDLTKKAITRSAADGKTGFDAVRTARELDGTLPDIMRAAAGEPWSVDKGAARTYARERPRAEHIEVAADPALAKTAQQVLNYNPFNVLPGLREAAALATALQGNPHLLGWIEVATHPIEAIALLGAAPAVAEAAARAFETHGVGIIKALPLGGLDAQHKAALARIGANATGKALHEATADRLTDDPTDHRNRQIAFTPGKHLGVVLDELQAHGGTAQDIQAACNLHPQAEAMEVLSDESNPRRIEFLKLLDVSPLTVFPWLAQKPPGQIFANDRVTDWLLRTEEPVAVLRSVAQVPTALQSIATGIDLRRPGAEHWVISLPSGYGLSPADEATLHAIYQRVKLPHAAKSLFMARFGHLPDGDWARDALENLWVTLARLPDRQVEDNRKLGGFTHGKIEPGSELAGSYAPGTGVVTINDEGGDESRYEDSKWMGKEQLAKHLGVDGADIDRRVTAGLVETKHEKDATLYRIKPVAGDTFTYTALHEVGHSVDAMLGNRTDLIYGLAGWKSYGAGDFNAWAAEMGAWSGAGVSADDKREIRTLFEQRLRSSSAISGPSDAFADLAPKQHAIRQARNASSFVAKAVRSGDRAFEYKTPVEHNGRMYLMNHYYGRFFSYDAKIHDILPLPYAGFAPEEFFAECYVEYYRDEQNKGGNLPAWIKEWFDLNVDRIGHGPAKRP